LRFLGEDACSGEQITFFPVDLFKREIPLKAQKSEAATLLGLLFILPIGYFRQEVSLRRLFSTFAHGCPGVGLLLMRLIAGIALIAPAVTRLRAGAPIGPGVLAGLAIGAGVLLLAGLWTPIMGWLVAVLGLWNAVSQPGDPWANILLATIGAALALLGPGAWSVDARLYGWKRIDIRDR